MMKRTMKVLAVMAVVAVVATFAYLQGYADHARGKDIALATVALAQQDQQLVSPTDARERDAYFPNSEPLAPDEMRVIACGTGMPFTRMAQAAPCFVVELGNGEKFIFGIGTGSMRNIASLMIPYEYLTKVFLTHLHTDHWGDLDSLWAGGWTSGRPVPLEVWGPAGSPPEMGTE